MKLTLTLLVGLITWQAHAADLNELQRLAAQRDPVAQYQLALSYQTGTDVEQSLQKAEYWFEQAAELGHEASQRELIQIYLSDSPSARDLQETLYWLNAQVAKGVENSHSRLGDFYSKYGEKLEAIDQSIAWYRVAANYSEKAEEKYNALLQAKFDGKRLQRVQQLEQLSVTFENNTNSDQQATGDSIEQRSGVIRTDIISIAAVSLLAFLFGVLKIKRRNKRTKHTGQLKQKQSSLEKQLKSSQRMVEKQKLQLTKIVKQYKKLQQMSEKKESSSQLQLQNACTLFGCESNSIPDEKTLKSRYRQLSKIYHPDAGGSSSSMTLLNHSLKLLVALSKAQQARKSKAR